MRIIGQIQHSVLKITVFQLNMKYAVKLEAGLMEQTYKIRESDRINGLAAVEELIDEAFTDACLARFAVMNSDLGDAFKRLPSR